MKKNRHDQRVRHSVEPEEYQPSLTNGARRDSRPQGAGPGKAPPAALKNGTGSADDRNGAAAHQRRVAQALTDGTCASALIYQYLDGEVRGLDLGALAAVSADQICAIASGDLSQLESILLHQATALHAMFVDFAMRGKNADHREWQLQHTSLALKCVAQSRQAMVALGELRQPRTLMFAKQANVANGPQQINNGVPVTHTRAHAEQSRSAPNELLEAQHEQRLDAGAQGAASGVDPHLEALDPIDRTAKRGR